MFYTHTNNRQNYSFVYRKLNLYRFNVELKLPAPSAVPGPLSSWNRHDILQRFILVVLNAGFRTLNVRDFTGEWIWTKLLELDCEVLMNYSENSLSFNRKPTSTSTVHLASFRYLRNAGDIFVVTSCDKNTKICQLRWMRISLSWLNVYAYFDCLF